MKKFYRTKFIQNYILNNFCFITVEHKIPSNMTKGQIYYKFSQKNLDYWWRKNQYENYNIFQEHFTKKCYRTKILQK